MSIKRKHTSIKKRPSGSYHVYLHRSDPYGNISDPVWRLTIKPDGTEHFGTVNNMDVASTGGSLTATERRRMYQKAEETLGVKRREHSGHWTVPTQVRYLRDIKINGRFRGVELCEEGGIVLYRMTISKDVVYQMWNIEEAFVDEEFAAPFPEEKEQMLHRIALRMQKRVRMYIPWEKYDAGNVHPAEIRQLAEFGRLPEDYVAPINEHELANLIEEGDRADKLVHPDDSERLQELADEWGDDDGELADDEEFY